MDMGHKEIADLYRALQETPPLLRWDVYPSQFAPIFTAENALPQFAKWGFDGPHGKHLLINARAETVSEKPFFAEDFARNRCAIPCSGFYEWDESKNKLLFTRLAGGALFLAGFCKTQDVRRFVILTKPAQLPVAEFHRRTPALLEREAIDNYLNDSRFAEKCVTDANRTDLSVSRCDD